MWPPEPTSTQDPSIDSTPDSDGLTLINSGELKVASGIFALHKLKEKEEIVLGWEWDNGSSIHKFPGMLSVEAEAWGEAISHSVVTGITSESGIEKS